MKNTYKLERHSNETWVNLEPLMADIQRNYDGLYEMDLSKFTQKEVELLELKMIGLQMAL